MPAPPWFGPLGFSLEDRYLKRAGLDYWPLVDLRTYKEMGRVSRAAHPNPPNAKFYSNPRRRKLILDAHYSRGDFLFFGCETKGLGRGPSSTKRIDSRLPNPNLRNPASAASTSPNAVSIVLYESAAPKTGPARPHDRCTSLAAD